MSRAKKTIFAVLLLGLVVPARAQEIVRLTCNLTAPGFTGDPVQVVPCPAPFPYVVPSARYLCVTDLLLVNKYPWEPPRYNDTMHSMYFMLPGITVTAHAPVFSLRTPLVYGPGRIVSAWISNGMTEPQNIYGIVLGRLWADKDCTEVPAPTTTAPKQ